MNLAQAQARLAMIQNAIATILAGGVAEYSVTDRQMKYLSLPDLMKMETEFINLVARLQGGMFSVAQFRNPD